MRPKIFVLHIRQIIKMGIITVIGLILIFTLMYVFLGRNEESVQEASNSYDHKSVGVFSPGIFRAYVPLNYKNAHVYVTVSEDEIKNIELAPLTENQKVLYPLLEEVLNDVATYVLENQSLLVESEIYTRVTSEVLVNAIARAITEAMQGQNEGIVENSLYSYD